MHYIIGTNFFVTKQTNNWDSKFKLKESYSILSISPVDSGLRYIFGGRSGNVEIVFESGRQADAFIAAHRREQLPNYEAIYQRNTSL